VESLSCIWRLNLRQREIAKKIIENQANHILLVKGNQGSDKNDINTRIYNQKQKHMNDLYQQFKAFTSINLYVFIGQLKTICTRHLMCFSAKMSSTKELIMPLKILLGSGIGLNLLKKRYRKRIIVHKAFENYLEQCHTINIIPQQGMPVPPPAGSC
jgi:hypothetical protein